MKHLVRVPLSSTFAKKYLINTEHILSYCIRIYGNPVSVKSSNTAHGCKTFTRLSSQVKRWINKLHENNRMWRVDRDVIRILDKWRSTFKTFHLSRGWLGLCPMNIISFLVNLLVPCCLNCWIILLFCFQLKLLK
mgnify:CR=1 FL=1